MLVASSVRGQLVGCSRCEHTFEARPVASAGQFGSFVLVVAAIAVGVVVAWLIMRSR
jgi:hypothetical protein